MTWTPWSDTRVRIAAVFATTAIAVIARTTVIVLRADVAAPATPLTLTPGTAAPAAAPASPLGGLGALAPFDESRTGPPAAAVVTVMPLVPLVLVGTIAGTVQPVAVCRQGTAPARILHVGDTLGGWRLLQVAQGSAVFSDAASLHHEIRLSPPGT